MILDQAGLFDRDYYPLWTLRDPCDIFCPPPHLPPLWERFYAPLVAFTGKWYCFFVYPKLEVVNGTYYQNICTVNNRQKVRSLTLIVLG